MEKPGGYRDRGGQSHVSSWPVRMLVRPRPSPDQRSLSFLLTYVIIPVPAGPLRLSYVAS